MKYTPFVEYLHGRELDGFIEHAQDIRVIFLMVSRFVLVDRDHWPSSVLKESMQRSLLISKGGGKPKRV